jgi:hypothetical protein
MDNSAFVDTLISHTGVSFTSGERDGLVSGLANGTLTRSAALRSIAENQLFVNAKFNEAFVMVIIYLTQDKLPIMIAPKTDVSRNFDAVSKGGLASCPNESKNFS